MEDCMAKRTVSKKTRQRMSRSQRRRWRENPEPTAPVDPDGDTIWEPRGYNVSLPPSRRRPKVKRVTN